MSKKKRESRLISVNGDGIPYVNMHFVPAELDYLAELLAEAPEDDLKADELFDRFNDLLEEIEDKVARRHVSDPDRLADDIPGLRGIG